MEYGKIFILLVLAIFLFSLTGVFASEMGTPVASEDSGQLELSVNDDIIQIGLSADNEADADNLETHEEKNVLSQVDNDESMSAENDLQVLSTDRGNYSGLASEIGNGGNVELKHDYYSYDSGSTIEITVDNSVIDGKGAVIDMTRSSNMKAFYVSASGVTFKNINIINANFGDGEGGAIYFCNSATVTNCNFTANHAKNGGAVYFQSSKW